MDKCVVCIRCGKASIVLVPFFKISDYLIAFNTIFFLACLNVQCSERPKCPSCLSCIALTRHGIGWGVEKPYNVIPYSDSSLKPSLITCKVIIVKEALNPFVARNHDAVDNMSLGMLRKTA